MNKSPNVTKPLIETKKEKFNELINDIDELDDKTKILFKDIYENALQDRSIAQRAYDHCWGEVLKNPELHAVHGDRLSKYIERMSKANDQLLKLSELVEEALGNTKKQASVSKDKIFEIISSGGALQ